MTRIDKEVILQQVVESLEANLKVLVAAAFEAKEISTNEESKAENKYDTRGLEASYLASGQAMRAQKLQEQIYILKKVKLTDFNDKTPVGIGALVELSVDESESKLLFILPIGGVEVSVDKKKLQTITIESPLGQNMHSQVVGYEFQLNGKEYELTGVN